MPYTVLHYRSHVEADRQISGVTSLDILGNKSHYQETITLAQPDPYRSELTEAGQPGSIMKPAFHPAP
ncbi:MAG: hypothetical protein HOM69_07775 [Gammaproteobacteria bacterium]|nr:hypothetical protein [Gammaproteobacteria bacterium]